MIYTYTSNTTADIGTTVPWYNTQCTYPASGICTIYCHNRD